jgi:acyl-CoA synthetase (AMP-forming)/AMP-acid ligase II
MESQLLHDSLRRAAKLYPDRPAVRCGERILTYRQVWWRSHQLANALRYGLRLPRQARFALLAPNTIEYPEIVMGAAISGCACVPVSFRLKAAEVKATLADAEARVLIVDPRLEQVAERVREVGFDGHVWWLGESARGGGDRYEDRLGQAAGRFVPRERLDDADVVLQIYTSGTTGRARGVMLSHRNLWAHALAALAEQTVASSDVSALVAPLCQIQAMSQMLTALQAAARMLVQPRFDPDELLRLAAGGAISHAFLAPEMLERLVESADRPGGGIRPRLRRLCYGGSRARPEVVGRALELFDCEFQQIYGLTEACPTLTVLRPEDHVRGGPESATRRVESVGRETIGVEVRVVDDEQSDVDPGDRGEVVARGPTVMEGYWRQPKATAEAIRDGWLRTGDVASVDEGGYVYLVDRKSDVLVFGGLNVYPREIEAEIEHCSLVRDVSVVGKPDPRFGEVPVAFVVLRAGGEPQEARAALDTLCRQRLAGFKVPREYRFISALPRNAAGKILRRTLRDQLLNGDGRAPHLPRPASNGS